MREIQNLVFWGLLAVPVMYLLPSRPRVRTAGLVVLSLSFLYFVLSPWVLVAMLAWVTGVFILGKLVERGITGKAAVPIYVSLVLAVFFAFKIGLLPGEDRNLLGDSAVPLGFSFLMFLSTAYLLDISRGRLRASDPLSFFAGALFFPTVSAGPFFKIQNFTAQLAESPKNGTRVFAGYCYFCFGIFQLGLSGLIAQEMLFQVPVDYRLLVQGMNPFGVLLLASIYLYANFSGYSSVAVGSAKMLGFEVPENFRFPFFSSSMADFWRKWHISLGAWIREYVFFPVHFALDRFRFVTVVSLLLSFLLIGLWHGIGPKYLLWAFLNALLVLLPVWDKLPKWAATLVVFLSILLVNGLFLAPDVASYFRFLPELASSKVLAYDAYNVKVIGFAFASLISLWAAEKAIRGLESDPSNRMVLLNAATSIATLFLGIHLGLGKVEFVYLGY